MAKRKSDDQVVRRDRLQPLYDLLKPAPAAPVEAHVVEVEKQPPPEFWLKAVNATVAFKNELRSLANGQILAINLLDLAYPCKFGCFPGLYYPQMFVGYWLPKLADLSENQRRKVHDALWLDARDDGVIPYIPQHEFEVVPRPDSFWSTSHATSYQHWAAKFWPVSQRKWDLECGLHSSSFNAYSELWMSAYTKAVHCLNNVDAQK